MLIHVDWVGCCTPTAMVVAYNETLMFHHSTFKVMFLMSQRNINSCQFEKCLSSRLIPELYLGFILNSEGFFLM